MDSKEVAAINRLLDAGTPAELLAAADKLAALGRLAALGEMGEETAGLLRSSSFATVVEASQFIAWFEEEGQFVSEWDKARCAEAKAILTSLRAQ